MAARLDENLEPGVARTSDFTGKAGRPVISEPLVFLVDVDNTLLDNDRIQADLRRHLEREFGAACRDRTDRRPGSRAQHRSEVGREVDDPALALTVADLLTIHAHLTADVAADEIIGAAPAGFGRIAEMF